MVGEIFAGLSAFKTMFDLAQAMKNMDDAVKRNAAVAELWEQIFAAQTRYAEAVERVSTLEEKLASFETWETEKDRYELKKTAAGAMVWSLKPDEQGSEQPHQICTNCYENRKRSILQPKPLNMVERQTGGVWPRLFCPACKMEINA